VAQLPLALPALNLVQVKVPARAELAPTKAKAITRAAVLREASQRLPREGLLFMVSMTLVCDLWLMVLDCSPRHDRSGGWGRVNSEVGFISFMRCSFGLRTMAGNLRVVATPVHLRAV
jgi:hypothetical protein